MTAETDLLPCPGCNGTNTRVIGGPGTHGGPEYWAGCDQCRWRTWGNTEAEAIAAWNRRAQSAEIEALRAEVDFRDSVIATHAADTREYQKRISQAEASADSLRTEVEALRELCGMAYQLAGVHDAPERWLDALSNAAAGRPFSTDGLLPYWPQTVCEASQPGGSDNDR